jgi:hypothetical protein
VIIFAREKPDPAPGGTERESNAVGSVITTPCFWCLVMASLVASLELYENDLARFSRGMISQVFAMHQAVHVAMLVSVSCLCVWEGLWFRIPFTDQAKVVQVVMNPFEQVRRLASNQDSQQRTSLGLCRA